MMKKIPLGIDAGHGGTSTGATRPQFPKTEADYNIDLGHQLERAIKASGLPFDPIMIRTGSETVSLHERGVMSRSLECKLVLHLHVNASPHTHLHGGLVFHWPGNKLGEAVGNAIARALPSPLFRQYSQSIAATDLPIQDDDWLERPRAVQRYHDMTTVLLEVGYMSHAVDRVELCREPVKAGLIVAIEAGLCEAWRRMD